MKKGLKVFLVIIAVILVAVTAACVAVVPKMTQETIPFEIEGTYSGELYKGGDEENEPQATGETAEATIEKVSDGIYKVTTTIAGHEETEFKYITKTFPYIFSNNEHGMAILSLTGEFPKDGEGVSGNAIVAHSENDESGNKVVIFNMAVDNGISVVFTKN